MNSETASMGWSERARVSSCATTHERAVARRGTVPACSQRQSNLAQLVGVTWRGSRNMGPSRLPGGAPDSRPDLVRSPCRRLDRTVQRAVLTPRDAHTIHTAARHSF